MGEPLDSINTVFGKLSEFLNVFDLSFFISGATCLGAVVFWVYHRFGDFFKYFKGILGFAIIIIASYVLGLICFSGGRWVRRRFQKRDTRYLWSILADHGLDKKEPFKNYMLQREAEAPTKLFVQSAEVEARKANKIEKKLEKEYRQKERNLTECLYTRLWAEVRQNPKLQASLQHLNRYWIMAATYDGLIIAILVWIIAFFDLGYCAAVTLNLKIKVEWIIYALLLLICICVHESKRLDNYQIGELAATMAYACQQTGKE